MSAYSVSHVSLQRRAFARKVTFPHIYILWQYTNLLLFLFDVQLPTQHTFYITVNFNFPYFSPWS